MNAIVALAVGVSALGITAYTAYLQRRQAQAAVWPRVAMSDGSLPSYHLNMANKGVGPALVRYARVTVDGHAVKTWEAATRLMLDDGAKHPYTWIGINHAILTPGESIQLFSAGDAALSDAFRRGQARIAGSICYCSIFDECWTIGDDHDEATPVAACPKADASSFEN